MTSLKWGKLDLCPGWYCSTPPFKLREEAKKIWRNVQGSNQSTIFLSGKDSWDWLLEINTGPAIAAGQLDSGSICISLPTKKLLTYLTTYFQVEQLLVLGIINQSLLLLFFFAEDNPMCTPTARDSYERLSLAGQTLPPGFPSPFLFPDGLSSIETLLTNIQVLLLTRVLVVNFALNLWPQIWGPLRGQT